MSTAASPRYPSGRPMNNVELVDAICASSPVLRDACRVHRGTFGTLVPHVFMSDVLARVGACLQIGGAHALREHGPELEGILAALECGMAAGDRETRNVISISFANDGELELFFDDLRPLLGPRIRAQLQGK